MLCNNRRVVHAVCHVVGVVALLLIAQSPTAFGADAVAPGQRYDVREQTLTGIPPGTVIGDAAPKNWTHLIIKSQPRAAAGDLSAVPEITVSMAQLVSVSIVANVTKMNIGGRPEFVLDRAGIGLGTKINGRDVIVTSDTQAKLGANLGIVARTVFNGSEAEIKQVKRVLRSRNLLTFDAPAIVVHQNDHRKMILRHALVLDPTSGQLNTLIWLIDKNDAGEYLQAIGTMNLLPPTMLEDRKLSIDANRFTLGIPSSTAIAMVRIPPGQTIAIPPTFLAVAAAQRFTEETARVFDAELRSLLRQIPRDPSMVRTTSRNAASETSSVGGN